MSYVQEQYDDVWRTRTVVQTSSSSMQLLRISNLMVMTWKSERDGLRRQDAERASRHMQTNTWYDVKHVDMSIVWNTDETHL